MTPIPFDRSFDAPVGVCVPVGPRIQRLLAPNPGPFTFRGTGVYIVGARDVAVIDPGPDIPAHIAALKEALSGRRVTHILVTHTHSDHSAAAAPLKKWSGAPTFAFGPHATSTETDCVTVEEGGDHTFEPDVAVRDGDSVAGDGFSIECVFTPGHTSNHMSYALKEEDALFTGDHVMGWSTTVVAPPDGAMAKYRASLAKLLERDDSVLLPTHGGPVREPKLLLQALLAHRAEREEQILVCLREGVTRIPDIVARLYTEVDKRLHPAAAMSVLAHLIELAERNCVTAEPGLKLSASYRLRRSV